MKAPVQLDGRGRGGQSGFAPKYTFNYARQLKHTPAMIDFEKEGFEMLRQT